MKWPNGARCAVMLTFDFDAETIWTAKDPGNVERPGLLSLGWYGARVGVPKILEFLKAEQLPATFFIPGWVVENHTRRVGEILDAGHEIAHHGYSHVAADPANPAQVDEELEKGFAAFERHFALRPLGHRAASGEMTWHQLQRLKDAGLLYNSNLKDHYLPYRQTLRDGSPGVIELPLNPTLDDGNYGMSWIRAPRPLYPKEAVLSIWRDEFIETHRWGGLFVLVMHPQVTGRPMRLATLRELVQGIRRYPDVWFATGIEVARHFEALERELAPGGAMG
jgi:peptidoglycan/xylan/chitin deacetylase (PgdA/CDA1 family)